jgi:hypothetical protein
MTEREKGKARGRGRGRSAAVQEAAEELLIERAVGEPASPVAQAVAPPRDAASLLRPQQTRNVVWRWHVRRRQ